MLPRSTSSCLVCSTSASDGSTMTGASGLTIAHASTSISSPGLTEKRSHKRSLTSRSSAALCPGASITCSNSNPFSAEAAALWNISKSTLTGSASQWTPCSMSRNAMMSWLGLVGLNVSNVHALRTSLTYGEPVTLLYHRWVGGASF